MRHTTINQLNQLNQDFYRQNNQSFSATRQSPWPGWKTSLKIIGKSKFNQIFDIGCGNGRFLDFLLTRQISFCNYLGVDFSKDLLTQAKQLESIRPGIRFLHLNLLDSLDLIDSKYELIVAFGVLHHIPSYQHRLKLLLNLKNMLAPKSYLILSFWQFVTDERFQSKLIAWDSQPQIDQSDLEKHDYLLSWQNSQTPRYCHHFTNHEIHQLADQLDLKQIANFHADGKTDQLNQYVIWER